LFQFRHKRDVHRYRQTANQPRNLQFIT
jgi:hypothetical protein